MKYPTGKLTLKKMQEMAQEIGETPESVFRQGYNCLLSARSSLENDRKNPIKYQIDRIINNLFDINIAKNILREWWGIQFCDIRVEGRNHLQIQVYNGIDEIARALNKEPKETNNWQLKKSFDYEWVEFLQLAERNSTDYKRAFDGNPCNYSTTYEKAYGGAGKWN